MNLFAGWLANGASATPGGGRHIATGVVSAIAAGLLFGLSFVATPAKFLAANVPLDQLLAVGRVTFRASAAVEALLLLVLLIVAPKGLRRWPLAIAAVLAAQHWLLMPELDARALAVMAGEVLPPTPLHAIWIAGDLLRIGAYGVLCAVALRACTGRRA
jgi:hypothetical protein